MAFSVLSLGSGSGGNCTLVQAGRTSILIDAGFSARSTLRRLRQAGHTGRIDAILLTHEHSDHAGGAGPVSRKLEAPVFSRRETARRARLDERSVWGLETLPSLPFRVGELEIRTFPVPHDAVETVGFVITAEGLRLGYATDLGEVTPAVEAALSGCHVLAVEANHDVDMTRTGPYPWSLKQRILGSRGHLSNDATAALLAGAAGAETCGVVLTHISRTNNSPELALEAVGNALETAGAGHVPVTAAPQGGPSHPVVL